MLEEGVCLFQFLFASALRFFVGKFRMLFSSFYLEEAARSHSRFLDFS